MLFQDTAWVTPALYYFYSRIDPSGEKEYCIVLIANDDSELDSSPWYRPGNQTMVNKVLSMNKKLLVFLLLTSGTAEDVILSKSYFVFCDFFAFLLCLLEWDIAPEKETLLTK